MKPSGLAVLDEMSRQNLKINLAPLNNIKRMLRTRAGTEVTIGVAGDVVAPISTGMLLGGLFLADKDQFREVENALTVPVFDRGGGRGLNGYGEPMRDSYGAILSVYDSSSAEEVSCWLRVDGGNANKDGEASAHLNREGAIALIARLRAWVAAADKARAGEPQE